MAKEIIASWKEQGLAGRVDEALAQDYIDAFFGTYRSILPYFDEEFGRLTGSTLSERVLKNPVTGRIRRFPKGESDKLMREMKATLLAAGRITSFEGLTDQAQRGNQQKRA